MKRSELTILSAFLVTILWFGSALAFDMPAPGKWWHDERMISKLNLTDEQIKKMDEIFSYYRPKFLKLLPPLRQRHSMLREYLESRAPEEVDRDKLSQMVDDIHRVRTELEKSQLIWYLDIRKTLTSEQNEILKQMRHDMMRHMQQMGMGRGGPMGGMGMKGR
jgi:Spy/CpxP family protein refolding chaperone